MGLNEGGQCDEQALGLGHTSSPRPHPPAPHGEKGFRRRSGKRQTDEESSPWQEP